MVDHGRRLHALPGSPLEKPSEIAGSLKKQFTALLVVPAVTAPPTPPEYAMETSGRIVRHLDTGLAAGSLAGLTLGPDGRLYFVDMLGARILRVDF